MKSIRWTLALVCAVSCKTIPVEKMGSNLHLTIVGTNDVHGWVLGQKETFPKGEIRFAGASVLAGYLSILRKHNPDGVVLLDAGDMFQGTLVSNLSEGAVVIEAFNRLHYDAATIGNHEFDYGPVGSVSAVTPGLDPFGALRERVVQAHFPLLSANMYQALDGARPSWLPSNGTSIIERHGLKIGLVGLTTPTTPSVTLAVNVATLRFGELAAEARAASASLRAQGADVVVALVHAGGKCGDVSHAEDLSSCDTDSGEIFEMMRALPPGTLDAVVAGHTHAQMGHLVNGTPIIESGALGRNFGTIELTVNGATHRVMPLLTRINSGIEICETVDAEWKTCDVKKLKNKGDGVNPVPATFLGQPVVTDASLVAALEPAELRVRELQNRDLGLKVPKTMSRSYEDESALGNLLADSMRAVAKADVALLNPGGIRGDLKAGQLTYGGLYEVLPFDNAVSTVSMSGIQLEALMRAAFAARKGVFQVSGLEVILGRCPTGARLKSFALVGGKNIEAQKSYVVAMPDFLARGGDGLLPVVKDFEPSQFHYGDKEGRNLREDLLQHWLATKETFAAPNSGRVRFVDGGKECL
jgi:5'-nucleotidase